MSDTQAREDLLRAAQIMNERGKCEGSTLAEDGKVCMLGAIGLAALPNFRGSFSELEQSSRAMEAANLLIDHIGGKPNDISAIYRHNDKRLKGFRKTHRTVRTMRRAAGF